MIFSCLSQQSLLKLETLTSCIISVNPWQTTVTQIQSSTLYCHLSSAAARHIFFSPRVMKWFDSALGSGKDCPPHFSLFHLTSPSLSSTFCCVGVCKNIQRRWPQWLFQTRYWSQLCNPHLMKSVGRIKHRDRSSQACRIILFVCLHTLYSLLSKWQEQLFFQKVTVNAFVDLKSGPTSRLLYLLTF